MEALLRAVLTGYAPLTDLVPAERIVWNHLPQGEPRPAIVLFRISGAPGIHMQGSDNLLNATVQIDVQALSVSSMWDIRSALVARLHGFKENSLRVFFTSERQTSEELVGALIHRCSMDFNVWATES